MNEFNPTLNSAIENLYKVFSGYFHVELEGCPCCVKPSDNKKIKSKPLRELTAEDLSRYSFKALTTWGDEKNFKYFLPRIFELVAKHTLLTDTETVFGKLNYGGWREWAKKEQDAIEEFFLELVRYSVEFDKEKAYITAEFINSIAVVVEDISPYLQVWIETLSKNKVITLHYFVIENKHGSMNPWLSGLPDKRKQIISWLTKAETIEYFEKLFFKSDKFQDIKELPELIDAIMLLKEVS